MVLSVRPSCPVTSLHHVAGIVIQLIDNGRLCLISGGDNLCQLFRLLLHTWFRQPPPPNRDVHHLEAGLIQLVHHPGAVASSNQHQSLQLPSSNILPVQLTCDGGPIQAEFMA